MKKDIKVNIYVRIDGEYKEWEGLTKEWQQEIGKELSKRAFDPLGFVPAEGKKKKEKENKA